MGGGVAMRVAGKIAGFVNGSFRGGFPALPENISSAAFKANSTRPITGVISSSDTQIDAASSTMTKHLIQLKDWELAEEVASSCDVGQPLPRLVFGGPPTLEEAKDATFQLRAALDQAYLSTNPVKVHMYLIWGTTSWLFQTLAIWSLKLVLKKLRHQDVLFRLFDCSEKMLLFRLL